jgi:hypothetical protein
MTLTLTGKASILLSISELETVCERHLGDFVTTAWRDHIEYLRTVIGSLPAEGDSVGSGATGAVEVQRQGEVITKEEAAILQELREGKLL